MNRVLSWKTARPEPLGVENDASGDTSVTHPADKVLDGNSFGWWYNPANGIVRSRILDQNDNEANLDLYRTVNITSIGSLADVD